MPVIQLNAKDMKLRRASRVLVLDPKGRVLLFEYSHSGKQDALANKGSYFTVPGGKAKPLESFEECAARELAEETGLDLPISSILAVRQAPLMVSSGDVVLASEQYYAVFVDQDQALDTSKWTEREKRNIKGYSWCTAEDLERLKAKTLWPSTLDEIVLASLKPQPVLEYKSTREQIGDVIIEVNYD